MRSGYTHSETFATLKTHKETVTDNLSSHQYLQTLDMLIWNALTPIIRECPKLIHGIFAKYCAQQTQKPNTKMTSDLKEKLPVIFFNAIYEKDTDRALTLYRSMYLNRGLLFGTLSLFLSRGLEYVRLHSAFNDAQNPELQSALRQLEIELGARSSTGLYAAVRETEYWDKKARTWRSIIIEKYARHAQNVAQRTYIDYGYKLDLDDTIQIHLMMVGKAVDRCDARLGVITTFVNPWLKGARSQVEAEIKEQELDSLEDLQERTDVEFSSDFDTYNEDLEHIAYRSKIIDPVGLARTFLGIPQWVSAKDRQVLMSFALEPG